MRDRMQARLDHGAAEAIPVGELTARIKGLLEESFPAVWVRGEVSNLRVQASGHSYFTLKDDRAQLAAVLFRGHAAAQRVTLRDGMQVVVFGEVSVYEQRGQYQLIVRLVVEDGAGRLQAEFERLKAQLAAEGLFEAGNKVPLPVLPRTIGFVTSPTGAAVQDFLRILGRRGWRGRVIVLPAKVQGEGAAAEMIEMLEWAQRAAAAAQSPGTAPARKTRRRKTSEPQSDLFTDAGPVAARADGAEERVAFDLLVIGRGGGSLEDLWAFNEEPLVRAVAACRIPIISAVGHEIDFTLCDFAADCRAETPSAAAEMISSGFLECEQRVADARRRLGQVAEEGMGRAHDRVTAAANHLRLLSPTAQIEQAWLRLDDLANRMGAVGRAALADARGRLSVAHTRLERATPEMRVRFESQRLLGLWKRLEAASPRSVLNRGFAIVRREDGQPVPRRQGLRAGTPLRVQFADGEQDVRTE